MAHAAAATSQSVTPNFFRKLGDFPVITDKEKDQMNKNVEVRAQVSARMIEEFIGSQFSSWHSEGLLLEFYGRIQPSSTNNDRVKFLYEYQKMAREDASYSKKLATIVEERDFRGL
jgi:hypothetical protein